MPPKSPVPPHAPPAYSPTIGLGVAQAKLGTSRQLPVTAPPVYRPAPIAVVQAKLVVTPVGSVLIQLSRKQEKINAAVEGKKKRKEKNINKTVANLKAYQSGTNGKEAREFALGGGYVPGHHSDDSNSKQNSGTASAIAKFNEFVDTKHAATNPVPVVATPVLDTALSPDQLEAAADKKLEDGLAAMRKFLRRYVPCPSNRALEQRAQDLLDAYAGMTDEMLNMKI